MAKVESQSSDTRGEKSVVFVHLVARWLLIADEIAIQAHSICFRENKIGRIPLTGERTQATLRGRPRGRLGIAGSTIAFFRDRFGSTQGAGAIL